MIGFLFVMLCFIGIGFLAIYRGKEGIKNRRMSNSAKSALFTGITELKGEQAVAMGKVSIVLGYVFIAIGAIGFLGGSAFGTMSAISYMMSGPGRTVRTTNNSAIENRNRRNPTPRVANNRPDNDRSFNDRVDTGMRNSGFDNLDDADFFNGTGTSKSRAGDPGDDLDFNGSANSKKRDSKSRSQPKGLGVPSQPMPDLFFDKKKTRKSQLVGFSIAKNQFWDPIEADRVLVGLTLSTSRDFGGCIQSIQPIYQRGNEYIEGKVFGDVFNAQDREVLLAPPGHLVCGMNVHSGVRIMSIQLNFCPVDEEGKINVDQIVSSQRCGVEVGKQEDIFKTGKPVVGIYGAYHRNEDLSRIGLVSAALISRSQQLASDRESDAFLNGTPEPPSELREFVDATGKFKVQARLTAFESDSAVLEMENGETKKVPWARLCLNDQRYVANFRLTEMGREDIAEQKLNFTFDEPIEFSDASGQYSIQGTFVAKDQDDALIWTPEGKQIRVGWSKLDDASKDRIKKDMESRESAPF